MGQHSDESGEEVWGLVLTDPGGVRHLVRQLTVTIVAAEHLDELTDTHDGPGVGRSTARWQLEPLRYRPKDPANPFIHPDRNYLVVEHGDVVMVERWRLYTDPPGFEGGGYGAVGGAVDMVGGEAAGAEPAPTRTEAI